MKCKTLYEGFKCSEVIFFFTTKKTWVSFSTSFHLVLLYLSLLNWRLETWKMRVLLNPTVVVLLQCNCTWRKKRAFLLYTQAWTSSDFSECEYLLPNHNSSDAPYWLHVCLVCGVCVWEKVNACVHMCLCSLVLNVHFCRGMWLSET